MSLENHNLQPEIGAAMLNRYLLGELSPEEQDRLEDQLFAGGQYGQLAAAEEDLIEAYVRGELSAPERTRFERHFLVSPERRKQVEFTKTLLMALDENPPPLPQPAETKQRWSWLPALWFPSPAVRFAWIATGVVVVSLAIWLAALHNQLREERARSTQQRQQQQQQQQQLASERARNQQLAAELETARDKIAQLQSPPLPASPLTLAFTLSPDEARSGGERKRLVIAPAVRSIQLLLPFDSAIAYSSLRVSLETAEGRRIAQRPAKLTAPGKAFLILPASLLATNDYILTLQGITAAKAAEDLADYQFTVVKQ